MSGPKQGSHEMFADNLPGLPDNIRRSERGGYWVAFAVVRHPEKFSVWDTLSNKPWIRRQMAKVGARMCVCGGGGEGGGVACV